MYINPLHAIDFYKSGHMKQYPEGTTLVYSNFTPRSGERTNLPKDNDGRVVFFGLQYIIQDFLINQFNTDFFEQDKSDVVSEYKHRMDTSLGKDAVPTEHIEALHDLGYLPICIMALPEGTAVPYKVPMLTIHNTKPEFFWLTNYLETVLSNLLWLPCTSATTARYYHKLLMDAAVKTGSPKDFVPWQAHDFSFRGMSSVEAAAKSGAAHLLYFTGTDTVPAIDFLEEFYKADSQEELIGGSVPATEHSVMCMGSKESELETFRRLINEVYPSGIVSVVSDTWDFWQVVTTYMAELKEDVMKREGKLVIRPDSGDPVEIICGVPLEHIPDDRPEEHIKNYARDILWDLEMDSVDHGQCGGETRSVLCSYKGQVWKATAKFEWDRFDKQFYVIDSCEVTECAPYTPTPAEKGAVECLWEIFGGTITETGHKLLDPHIGLIYGDSITPERCKQILKRLEAKGFASANVVFGIGSYTYQYVTRDTHGFAMKSTYGEIDGVPQEIFKCPVTDNGTKKSLRGIVRVEYIDGVLCVVDRQEEIAESALRCVFLDGSAKNQQSLAEIRKRVSQ